MRRQAAHGTRHFERSAHPRLRDGRAAVTSSVKSHHGGVGHHVCCRCQELLFGTLELPASMKCWAYRNATCTQLPQISIAAAAPRSRPAAWPAYTRTSVTREALWTEFRHRASSKDGYEKRTMSVGRSLHEPPTYGAYGHRTPCPLVNIRIHTRGQRVHMVESQNHKSHTSIISSFIIVLSIHR